MRYIKSSAENYLPGSTSMTAAQAIQRDKDAEIEAERKKPTNIAELTSWNDFASPGTSKAILQNRRQLLTGSLS